MNTLREAVTRFIGWHGEIVGTFNESKPEVTTMGQRIHEGTPQQLAAWLGQQPNEKRYRIVEVEEPETEEEGSASSLQATPNEGVLSALREIAERQKGRRHTDGSQTDRLLREARAGAMWDCDTRA